MKHANFNRSPAAKDANRSDASPDPSIVRGTIPALPTRSMRAVFCRVMNAVESPPAPVRAARLWPLSVPAHRAAPLPGTALPQFTLPLQAFFDK
jgi:hypothetical protein